MSLHRINMKSFEVTDAKEVTLMPVIKPWEVIGWPAKMSRSIYRSWAQHFSTAHRNTLAFKFFNKCIDEYESEDFTALKMRSTFNRSKARPESALEDARRAARMVGPRHASVNHQIVDALYDLNEFEENKITLHENARLHTGILKQPFEQRIIVVNGNFKDNAGKSLTPFFLKHGAKLDAIHGEIQKSIKSTEGSTVRWKKLKELNQCDVQSVVDKVEIGISPLEAARRERKTKMYYQTYCTDIWKDIAFLRKLSKSPNIVLDKHSLTSAEKNRTYLESCCKQVKTFTGMLHARSPIYNEMYKRGSDSKMFQNFHQANMFRIQYQTRRNMLSILRTIRTLHAEKNIGRLREYVSKVMGEYTVLKTTQIMPWKTEFMNEVYNHLALALCEGYNLPDSPVSPYDNAAMCQVLGVSPFKPHEQPPIVFNDRSTFTYKVKDICMMKEIAALEKRLNFSKLPIERSYLYYEIADAYFTSNQHLGCLQNAKNSVNEARRACSQIWEFLATMLKVKSLAVLYKYERQGEILNKAYKLTNQLKSPNLCAFVELCRMLNKDYMALRKMTHLVTTKKVRYRQSNRSNLPSPSSERLSTSTN